MSKSEVDLQIVGILVILMPIIVVSMIHLLTYTSSLSVNVCSLIKNK